MEACRPRQLMSQPEKEAAERSCGGNSTDNDSSTASTDISDGDRRFSVGSLSTVEGRFDTRSFVQYHPHGEKIDRRYTINAAEIARGGYGKVFKAEDKQCEGRVVAVKKVLCMDEDQKARYMKEAKIMQELDHPGICRLFEVYEEDDELFMVLEYLEGGELFDKIVDDAMTEQEIADIINQVACALKYAHNCGVAHRDLKPENICLCSRETSQVKVIDWGLSSEFCKGSMKSAVGSATYAAPEVFSAAGVTTYTKACDLWSLGILTYVMFAKKPPFWGSPQMQIKKMRAAEYPMTSTVWQQTSADAKDFIKRLLKADPQQRMTVDEALCHPFLTGNHQKPDASRMESVLSNMVRFSSTPRFYSLVMASAARQMHHIQTRHLTRCFNAIDTNHDGLLDVAEMRYAFEATFGKRSEEVCQVQQMFNRLDLDGTGNITFTEFCAACMSDDFRNQEQTLWFAFKAFDNDDLHGAISEDDIEQLLSRTDVRSSLSENAYQEAAQEIIQTYDQDHDGGIDFAEFKCMVQACAKPLAMCHTPFSTQAGTLSRCSPDSVVTNQAQSYNVQTDALAPEVAATRSCPLPAVPKKSKSWTVARLFKSASSLACFRGVTVTRVSVPSKEKCQSIDTKMSL